VSGVGGISICDRTAILETPTLIDGDVDEHGTWLQPGHRLVRDEHRGQAPACTYTSCPRVMSSKAPAGVGASWYSLFLTSVEMPTFIGFHLSGRGSLPWVSQVLKVLPEICLLLDPNAGSVYYVHPAVTHRCAVEKAADGLEYPRVALGATEPQSRSQHQVELQPRCSASSTMRMNSVGP